MKKNVLKFALSTALIAGTLTANAQVDLGVKGGFSLSKLAGGFDKSNATNEGYDFNAGGGALIYGEYHFSKAWSVQLGVGYANQGGKREGLQAYNTATNNVVYSNFDSKTNLGYLTIPVLAKYGLNFGDGFTVYLEAGPYVSFLMDAKQKNTNGIGNSTEQVQLNGDIDIKDQLETFNIGAQADLGFKYAVAPRHSLFVEVGSNYGFLNIMKETTGGDNKSLAMTANIGYAFRLSNPHSSKTTVSGNE